MKYSTNKCKQTKKGLSKILPPDIIIVAKMMMLIKAVSISQVLTDAAEVYMKFFI